MAWNMINGLQVLYCFLRVSNLQYQLATVNLAFLLFLSVWMAYAVSVYIRNVSRAALPSNFMLSGVKKPCSYGNNDAQTGWYRCQGHNVLQTMQPFVILKLCECSIALELLEHPLVQRLLLVLPHLCNQILYHET